MPTWYLAGNERLRGPVPAAAAGAAGYHANAVNLGGTTAYFGATDIHTSFSDSKVGMFSVWLKSTNDTVQTVPLETVQSGNFWMDTAGRVRIDLTKTSGGAGISAFSSTGVFVQGVWTHIIWSWDTAVSRLQLYVNGSSVTPSVGSLVNDTIAWTTSTQVFPTGYSSYPFPGDMADLYFNIATSLDLTTPANLALFITAGGKPVDLGSTGTTPTGSAPVIFMSAPTNSSGDATAWATNKNVTTGGFTVASGSLAAASTSPSD